MSGGRWELLGLLGRRELFELFDHLRSGLGRSLDRRLRDLGRGLRGPGWRRRLFARRCGAAPVKDQQAIETDEDSQDAAEGGGGEAVALAACQRLLEPYPTWSGCGRTGAHDREPNRYRQHRQNSVNDRHAGDEVEGERDRPAQLIRKRVDGERHGGNAEGDYDTRQPVMSADAESEWRKGTDRREGSG